MFEMTILAQLVGFIDWATKSNSNKAIPIRQEDSRNCSSGRKNGVRNRCLGNLLGQVRTASMQVTKFIKDGVYKTNANQNCERKNTHQRGRIPEKEKAECIAVARKAGEFLSINTFTMLEMSGELPDSWFCQEDFCSSKFVDLVEKVASFGTGHRISSLWPKLATSSCQGFLASGRKVNRLSVCVVDCCVWQKSLSDLSMLSSSSAH